VKRNEVRIINKAYKFRLYPNQEQKNMFAKTFGCVRFIYNKMLSDKIDYYKEYKQKLNNTPAQYKKEFKWLNEVDSLALSNAQMNLQTAYKNFFRSPNVGFPKFKSKHKNRMSYITNNQNGSIRIEGNQIKIPKVGFVKIKLHRKILNNYIIKSCTISKTPSEKYYVSILVEFKYEIPKAVLDTNNFIGLDMDMKHFYTDSNGIRAEYPRYYRQMLDKLKKEQRKLSKCKLGSNNRNKQRCKIAKIYEKITNQRKDFLHKLSNQITNDYDGICIETLNMQLMSQCLHLGKSVSDNGWGMFTTFLKYKLEWKGKPLIKIDKWYPSSKTCHHCGYVNSKLTLSDREWICESCGETIDRDWNAAENIRDEGIRTFIA